MNDDPRVRVLCMDDQPMTREGIAALLSRDATLELIAEASEVGEGVAQIELLRPDVVLTDLQLPDGTAFDVIAAARLASPDTRVIVFTRTSGDLVARRALDAGAAAWLLKRSHGGEILDAIRGVTTGRRIVDADVRRTIEAYGADTALTERETQVLGLVSRGLANREIAQRLSLTEGTVKNYLAQILDKFGAEDRTHAVVVGMRRGAIAPC